jgi:hypothetical protein
VKYTCPSKCRLLGFTFSWRYRFSQQWINNWTGHGVQILGKYRPISRFKKIINDTYRWTKNKWANKPLLVDEPNHRHQEISGSRTNPVCRIIPIQVPTQQRKIYGKTPWWITESQGKPGLSCGYSGQFSVWVRRTEQIWRRKWRGGKNNFHYNALRNVCDKKLIFFWSHASENEFLFPLESKK